jgi:glucose/arabinose dehydrogenase
MTQRILALLVALSVAVLAVGCGSGGDQASPTPTPATPTASAASQASPSGSPVHSDLSLRGENVEKVANSAVQTVTWADGTVYEETIWALMLRTLGQPDASHGRRVVARWLEDDRWQVTIFLHMEDRSTDPPTVTDLQAEFYYDEASGTFEAANGRASFALTGRDPCAGNQPAADLCPLDKQIGP